MKPAKNIEKLIKSICINTNAKMDETILDDVLEVFEESKKTKPTLTEPSIWRVIMKSRITKLTAAAVSIIAFMLITYLGNGTLDLTTTAFAQMTEAMKKMPWLHVVSTGHMRGVNVSGEEWVSFKAKIRAGKRYDGKITFWNTKEHKHYTYDPEKRNITIDYVYDAFAHEDESRFELSSPASFLENKLKRLQEQGAEIITKEAEYNGQQAQLQEISFSVEQNNESLVGRLYLYIQPDSKLLLAARAKAADSTGKIIGECEMTYSYPQTGPLDIYDLGVPKDAQIISNLPEEDYQAIWDKYRQSREKATKEYIAVITHSNQRLGDIVTVTMIDVDFKSNKNHRLERHFVFNTGEDIEKSWPKYKEQLGDTFESLMAWTQNHYGQTGTISIYLYDGEYNISTSRDGDSWEKIRKSYSPNFESIPSIRLEDIAWPIIGKTGRIIEDDYARENNFICIERLQRGSIYRGNVNLPGRFLYYLDPQKDYICRRKVTEWRPDAEWQENKNWLEGVNIEKVRDGSIIVKDIIELTQAENGLWYPKVIEEKQTGIRKDYKNVPLKISTIKKVYIQTHPEFTEGIFDHEMLPKNR